MEEVEDKQKKPMRDAGFIPNYSFKTEDPHGLPLDRSVPLQHFWTAQKVYLRQKQKPTIFQLLFLGTCI